MLILDPSLEDKDAKAAVDRFLTTVTSRGGTVG
ncbi:MAG TPA: 30S ribosomal protein S6, partial [Actinomycetota bacterium]|nr:30S ribosomal protein S6 [Actinomycetota bacterium]